MANNLIRLFIAIEVSHDQRNDLISLQKRLKGNLEGVKWVRPEGLHLTLKFLGAVEKEKIELIEKLMDSAVTETSAFQVKYENVGVFPNLQKARVIWVGLSEGLEEACKLAENIEKNCNAFNFTKESRPYHPHLTLGRFRYNLQEDLVQNILIREKEFSTKPAIIERITLFSSQLFQQGAVYQEVYRSAF